MKKLMVALLLASGLAGTARADEEVLVTFKMMTPETALALAQAALQDCRDKGYQVAVAVVDRSGIVQVILRDRYAGVHTVDTARRKAWTAVSFRTDTTVMAENSQAGKEASGVRFVDDAMMIGGGMVVRAAGAIVGGVGVSGAPGGPADDECAKAGIDAV
ncbi:MAG: heme-binding protein, partial [Alphaproteobacteria bacterium]|nr:heme-binding protein [Alphaproteobacteria bacterium]